MRKMSKVHCYKEIILLSISLLLIPLLISCSKNGEIQFCEGTNAEETPVKCGTVFTTGDLSLIINSESSFKTTQIKVKIFNTESSSSKAEKNYILKVDPSKNYVRLDTELYNPGKYKVIAENNSGDIVSEGFITIINDITPNQE